MICSIIFTILLAFTALVSSGAGIFFLKMNEKNLSFWEGLPRNKAAGTVIGGLALLCFIPNVRPLFSPEENLIWLIAAALVLTFLCYKYLDHLFARASAGALILLVHFLLAESFNADLKGRVFFALFCFAAGTFAIFIAAKPYWLRDCFRAMCRKKCWKMTGVIFSFLWSITSFILLIQQAGRFFAK